MKNFEEIISNVTKEVERELLAAMREHNLEVLNLATADVLQGWDELFAYRYNGDGDLEERNIIGLRATEWGLDVISISRFEFSCLDDSEDTDLSPYLETETDKEGKEIPSGFVDPLFSGDLLGIFTAYNLSEVFSNLIELIAEQSE